jgi:hypothetical protein
MAGSCVPWIDCQNATSTAGLAGAPAAAGGSAATAEVQRLAFEHVAIVVERLQERAREYRVPPAARIGDRLEPAGGEHGPGPEPGHAREPCRLVGLGVELRRGRAGQRAGVA